MSHTSIYELAGTWHIIESTFPMWLKGDKLNPTLNYSIAERKGKEAMLDEVKYTKNGKTKTITGYDYPDENSPNTYIWRGKGLLGLLKSEWEVVLADPNGQWLVSWFDKTPFTPEGVEIISRKPTLPAEVIEEIKRKLRADSDMAPFVKQLQPLPKQ